MRLGDQLDAGEFFVANTSAVREGNRFVVAKIRNSTIAIGQSEPSEPIFLSYKSRLV